MAQLIAKAAMELDRAIRSHAPEETLHACLRNLTLAYDKNIEALAAENAELRENTNRIKAMAKKSIDHTLLAKARYEDKVAKLESEYGHHLREIEEIKAKNAALRTRNTELEHYTHRVTQETERVHQNKPGLFISKPVALPPPRPGIAHMLEDNARLHARNDKLAQHAEALRRLTVE